MRWARPVLHARAHPRLSLFQKFALFSALLTVAVALGLGLAAESLLRHGADRVPRQHFILIWYGLAIGLSVLYLAHFFLVQRVSRRMLHQMDENRRLLSEVNDRARDTRLVYTLSRRLNEMEDLRAVIEQILHSATRAFDYPHVSVLLKDKRDGYLHHQAGTGALAATAPGARVAMGQGIIGRAAQEKRTTYVPDVRRDASFTHITNGTLSQVALPLKVTDQVIGVLNVESTAREAFGPRDLQLLSALADQAARAVQSAQLKAEREEEQLATLVAMARAIDARDEYTAGHSERVCRYSLIIAKEMGLPQADVDLLERAAKLHDVGKIGIQDAILTKPGPLTEEERAIMELHPVIGCEILSAVRFLQPALALIRGHHERYDGAGYPDRLAGKAIAEGARIIAVADTFDAMTSDRPYRKGMPIGRAREIIAAGRGSQFDPHIGMAMLRVIDDGRLVPERPSAEQLAAVRRPARAEPGTIG